MRPPGVKEQLRRRLTIAAHQEVQAVTKALPAPLRRHAADVPVLFEMQPHPNDVKQGIAPDTLGLFSGRSLADSHDTLEAGPTEILLYLENLWDYADSDSALFREEVRRTYLHELGHYLGLDEDDLAERGVD
jgi:predicted Zn-dependent protease with MMP-like domain